MTAPMVNGADTSDVPGSEEHSNAFGVPSSSKTSLTKDGQIIIPSRGEEHDDGASSSTESLTGTIPDPRELAQADERIVAGPDSVGDGQPSAQLNRTIVVPAGVIGAHNPGVIGAHSAGVVPAGVIGAHNPGVIGAYNAGVVPAGAIGAHNPGVIGAYNAGVVPAGVIGAHNPGVVPAGRALAQMNLGGAAAIVAPPRFDIDAGLSGPPLRRSEVGPFF